MRMMRLGLVLALAGSSAGAGLAQQPADAAAKAQVEQVERIWLDALGRGDTDAIAGILADDFVRPAPQAGAFITRAELLDYYRKHLAPDASKRRHFEGLTIAVYGETAIARGSVVTTDTSGHASVRNLFTDVFVRRGGKWLAVSAQENPVTGGKE